MANSSSPQKKLGKTIRLLRTNLGYSQEDFAGQCELHRTYMGAVERGERNVSLNNIVKIAGALEISAGALLTKARL